MTQGQAARGGGGRREQKDAMSNRPIGPEGGKRISYRYFNGMCRTRSIGVLDLAYDITWNLGRRRATNGGVTSQKAAPQKRDREPAKEDTTHTVRRSNRPKDRQSSGAGASAAA
jgi:hypothetical protein